MTERIASLGIDPGLDVGAAIMLGPDAKMLEHWTIGSPKKRHVGDDAPQPYPGRLVQILDQQRTIDEQVRARMTRLEPGTRLQVGIEKPFGNPNAATSLALFGVFAVIITYWWDNLNNPTEQLRIVPSASLKSFLGVTKKAFVIREVWRRWKFDGATDHHCDAFALAMFNLERPDWTGPKPKRRRRKT